ncbi:hypothetical protein ABKN59_009416 [Abortiporus biennis]
MLNNMPKEPDSLLPLFVLTNLIRYTGIKLGYELPLSLKHDYVVVLYDNWTMGDLDMSEEQENRIVKVIQMELNPHFEPMWWWDQDRNKMRQDSYCQMDLYPKLVYYKKKDF